MKIVLIIPCLLLSVFLMAQTEVEPNGSFGQATPIQQFNQFYEAVISVENDLDFFSFEVTTAGVIDITINNVPANLDLTMRLYNPDQEEIGVAGGNNGEAISFERLVCETGTYYVSITDNEFNVLPYRIKVEFDDTDVYECNNDFSSASPIVIGQEVLASIREANDEDFYRFEVTQAGVIIVNVNNVPANLDLTLRLYDTDQTQIGVVGGNDGEAISLERLVCETGTYYLMLTDNESNEDQYRLVVSFDDSDIYECNNSFNDAASIPFDTDLMAKIRNADDLDYYKFEITLAGVIEVNVFNVPSNLDLEARLYNPLQEQIAVDSESDGVALFLEELVCEPGTYYLLITDNESNADPYSFRVSFDDSDIYECNNSFLSAAPIECNTVINAAIRSSDDDLDYYLFNVTEAGTLNISVNNVPDNIDLEASLFSNNQEQVGNTVSENDGEPINSSWMLPAAGDYYLLLTDNESNPELYELQLGCPGVVSATNELSLAALDFRIQPNPAFDWLTIRPLKMGAENSYDEIILYDQFGRQLKTFSNGVLPVHLDISDYTAGTYQLKLTKRGLFSFQKLIIIK